MLPLFERMVVHEQGWITMERFVDMIALSQVTPGPIAINSATFIGYQTTKSMGYLYGVAGSLVSTVGVVFVPVILVSIVSKYYEGFKKSHIVKGIFYGLRPVLVGLILSSVVSVAGNAIMDWIGVLIIIVLIILLVKFRLHPILVIFVSGILGVVFYL